MIVYCNAADEERRHDVADVECVRVSSVPRQNWWKSVIANKYHLFSSSHLSKSYDNCIKVLSLFNLNLDECIFLRGVKREQELVLGQGGAMSSVHFCHVIFG